MLRPSTILVTIGVSMPGVCASSEEAATAAKPAAPERAEKENAPLPEGMKSLGKNAQGYAVYKNEKDDSEMVLIPAGEFGMGSDDSNSDEKPQRRVYLNVYLMDKTEVTWGQYKRFCQETKRESPEAPSWGIKDNHPVVNVSWEDAEAYCMWAGKRLPTEAEWEKGARGTDGRTWPWGNEWDSKKANTSESGPRKTTPIGNYPAGASPWGLMDMAGNVWEWCSDGYDAEYYKNGEKEKKNPEGPETGELRVLRGGSWDNSGVGARCAFRSWDALSIRSHVLGFRCARDCRR